MEDEEISRRRYLITKTLLSDPGVVSIWMAVEAVATTAMEHPEWDMQETMTWGEWEDRGDE